MTDHMIHLIKHTSASQLNVMYLLEGEDENDPTTARDLMATFLDSDDDDGPSPNSFGEAATGTMGGTVVIPGIGPSRDVSVDTVSKTKSKTKTKTNPTTRLDTHPRHAKATPASTNHADVGRASSSLTLTLETPDQTQHVVQRHPMVPRVPGVPRVPRHRKTVG